jgi:L,D-transpeptidase ErfK/SrfK
MAFRSALSGAVCLALASCSVVDGLFTSPPEAPDQSAQEPVVIKAPLDSNRFPLVEGEDIVGQLQVTAARGEDTFVEFARTYGLGFDELRDANPGVDPWLPGEGTPVVLPTRFVLPEAPREGIVLNVAVKRLFYFPPAAEGEAPEVETYPIGIGREDWATPTGETSVVARARDPVWFVPASIRKEHEEMGDPLPAQVPPGPDNPLGTRVLQLGLPGYLIHGTNKPAGVGMRVSHGCVRLYPEDIESLFERVPVGTPVRIVNQPLLIGARGNEVFLESHPPLGEDSRDPRDDLDERLEARARTLPNGQAVVDVVRLETITAEQRGFPVSILAGGADTEATLRGARQVENIITHDSVEQVAAAAAAEPDSP